MLLQLLAMAVFCLGFSFVKANSQVSTRSPSVFYYSAASASPEVRCAPKWYGQCASCQFRSCLQSNCLEVVHPIYLALILEASNRCSVPMSFLGLFVSFSLFLCAPEHSIYYTSAELKNP